MGWNTCYGDGGDGYMPTLGEFTDEEKAHPCFWLGHHWGDGTQPCQRCEKPNPDHAPEDSQA